MIANQEKEKLETSEESVLRLIELVDKNFAWKWYDVFRFSPFAINLFFMTFIALLLYFYLPLAPLSERITIILVFFGLILAFLQVVASMPKLFGFYIIDRNHKTISKCVNESERILLKALITMKYKQPGFLLAETYQRYKSLFEEETLVKNLYE